MAGRDLAHQTFGFWKVKPEFRKDASGHREWLCECVCGTSKYVCASNLTGGKHKSCGCVRPEPKRRTADVPTKWVASDVWKLDRTGHKVLFCTCACGRQNWIREYDLKIGQSVQCGSCAKAVCWDRPAKKAKRWKMPGPIVGLWTVYPQFRTDDANHRSWRCVCACGTEKYIEASALTRGRSKSCGCTLWWWPHVISGKQWNLEHAR